MRGFDKDLEFAEVVWSLVDDYVDVATEDKAAVELCEELRKNGYTDEAKRLEIRLNGRAEQFVADLTPEQWNEISKRKFQ
jgi:hypothetical protein